MFRLFSISVILISSSAIHAQALPSLQFATAEQIVLPLEYELDGVVEATNQATLSSEVTGRIEQIYFDVGDSVNKDDIIVKIRDTEYRAREQIALASLKDSEARLREAKQEFKRAEDLFNKKLISASGFEKSRAILKTTLASVEAAEAGIITATEQLKNTTIRAPYSGLVIARHVEPGETIQAGQRIMSGYAIGQFRINTQVPQSIIDSFRKRLKARISILDDKITIPAENITIFPIANPLNHSFQVRLNLPETEHSIFPGMLVKVLLEIDQVNRLLIPASALVYRSEVSGVYVISQGQKLIFRQVRPGNQIDHRIEILAGLDAGEQVALDPVKASIRLKKNQESE